MNIHYMTCMDMAICKHSLGFCIALVSFCTCTGSYMVTIQFLHLLVLGGGVGSVYLGIQHAQTSLYSCQDREPLSEIFGSFKVLGEPTPKQVVSKVKWKTTRYCANEGTAQCIYAVEK